MDTGLRDKIVLITAASGIGRATAEAFAAEGARLGPINIGADALTALQQTLAVATAIAESDLSTADGVHYV